jgi:8-amino-7-oxononanoate synthase
VIHEVQPLDGARILVKGEEYINFSGNDYFGLTHHPQVIAAAKEAQSSGAGASRLITGTHPAATALERALADYKQTQAALVFGSGYLANLGVISALAKPGDLILADRLSHACMLDGAKLSGATLRRFRHNDVAHLESLLQKQRSQCRNCLILTETVFSMDGDRAPLEEILALAERYDCWVISDDAHGIGMVAPQPRAQHVQVGTLSKGLGCYGGYVCASQPVIEYLLQSARSFIFTTGLPDSVLLSAAKALEILRDDEARRARPLQLAKQVTLALNLPEAQSAVVPVIAGEADAAMDGALQLREKGLWVHAIRPPTVPKGTSRLRLSFSAAHTDEQVQQLIEALRLVR